MSLIVQLNFAVKPSYYVRQINVCANCYEKNNHRYTLSAIKVHPKKPVSVYQVCDEIRRYSTILAILCRISSSAEGQNARAFRPAGPRLGRIENDLHKMFEISSRLSKWGHVLRL